MEIRVESLGGSAFKALQELRRLAAIADVVAYIISLIEGEDDKVVTLLVLALGSGQPKPAPAPNGGGSPTRCGRGRILLAEVQVVCVAGTRTTTSGTRQNIIFRQLERYPD